MRARRLGEPLLEYHGGLHLRGTLLWFDAPEPRQLCFVSHALVAGGIAHQKIVSTETTAALLRAIGSADGRGRRAHEPQALVTPYRRSFALGTLELELFPAGHSLGSASLLVEHQGHTVVYAGAINPRRTALSERLEARRCDLLVLPASPAALRRLALPPAEDVERGLLRFVRETLEAKGTPVLFCAPVGEAQEVAALLGEAGLPLRAHRQIFAACRVYRERLGDRFPMRTLKRYQRSIDPAAEPSVLLWPAHLRHSPAIAQQPGARLGFVSGLALEPTVRAEMDCHEAFPLSAEADYAGLLEYVRACAPTEVALMGAGPGDLGRDLTALGIEVSFLGPERQLALF
ncbi:MAG: hypothetical protein IT371_04280 [Deltaproteobacteria bacterium]|nr:hypothetical protein [Deltaproteobacteria bacterium]